MLTNRKVAKLVILLLSPLVFFILLFPQKTEAAIPVIRVNITPSDPEWIKDYILKPIVHLAAKTLLQAITQQIIDWVQGNDGKNVGFVHNLQAAFRQQADIAGGDFLNKLTGINLCGNIGAFLQINLRAPGLRQQLECTVTDIIRNVNSFYGNFYNGGWPAFARVSLEPQNNPYGAYLIALDAKLTAEDNARRTLEIPLQKSYPFLGFRTPVGRNCFTRPASGANPIGNNLEAREEAGPDSSSRDIYCDTEYTLKTPGQLISDQLSKAFGTETDYIISAKDLDEAFGAIASTLINKLITSTFAGGSGSDGGSGIFEPTLPQTPILGGDHARFFIGRIQETIYYADAILVSMETGLKNSYLELFTLKRSPNLASTPDDAQIILEQIRVLEEKIAKIQNNKKEVLSIKNELNNFKISFSSATDPKETTPLAEKIPIFNSRLTRAASEVEITAAGGVSSGNAKFDTIQELQGSMDIISSSVELIRVVIDEMALIASITPNVSRKAEMADLINTATTNYIRPLQEGRVILSNIKDDLTRSIRSEEIQRLMQNANQSLRRAPEYIQTANDGVKAAYLILYPR